ncbi:MAG: FAD-dependent oxidoreductase [Nanoarchaeota archaeon]|nr:FAD-dependent oxidoreductase [Nanoarchaeota archaeon]
MNKIEKIIDELKKILDINSIITLESEISSKYKIACIPIKRAIPIVLKVKQKEEIPKILKLANKYNIAVYPISTGKNWGYGSANPVTNNNIILDLSQLNKIINYDEKLAYVEVEPGVSQEQLFNFLKEKNSHLMIDPSGSSPSCSLLGNSIERGFGIGPYNDHFDSVCSMEIILANGEILKTGFSHYENAQTKNTFKYGIGPYLNGIFSQSNFGIVTKIGL